MKNQTLNEQVSRIKGMMKINEDLDSSIDNQEKQITSVEDVISYVTSISSKVEKLSEEMGKKLGDTEFWRYVKPMYNGLRSVSDMEGFYTRNDQKEENIATIIEYLKNDYKVEEPDMDDNPHLDSERKTFNSMMGGTD